MTQPLSRVGVLAVVLALAGCANDSDGPSTPSLSEREVTTPRGLAAGVITHLDAGTVRVVEGSGDHASGVSVMVETSDQDARLVHVVAMPADSISALHSCGPDHGYTSISCSTEPFFREVATRKNLNDSEPQVIGRYLSNERGSLLIQVWGTDAQGTSTELLEELLDDPSIGVRTSPSLNAAGKQIEDFGVEKLVTEVHELR